VFTRADKILIITLIALSALSYPAIRYLSAGASFLEIEVNGQPGTVVRMDQDQDITVEGKLGTTIIRIDESGARFIQSPCADKKCIESAPIKDAGEIAVCIPNRVMIRVLGENRVKTDFISR
jgi:hypothetical protein